MPRPHPTDPDEEDPLDLPLASSPSSIMAAPRGKRAVLYLRVSTVDQNLESQLHDLRELAHQRGFTIVTEYRDHGVSGARTRRPALDQMLTDGHRGKFDVVLVWACDRLARSVRHFLEVLDQLDHLHIAFVSYREQIDTAGPLGRAIMVIVGAIAELERSLIIERVRAGMRRARIDGTHIGRPALAIDRASMVRHRAHGHSLQQIAKAFQVSKTTVARVLAEEKKSVPKGCAGALLQTAETTTPPMAA